MLHEHELPVNFHSLTLKIACLLQCSSSKAYLPGSMLIYWGVTYIDIEDSINVSFGSAG